MRTSPSPPCRLLVALWSILPLPAFAAAPDSLAGLPGHPFLANPGHHLQETGAFASLDALRNLPPAVGTAAASGYRPAVFFRRDGGMNSFAFSIREENTSSSGQRLIAGYDRFSDRDNPDGGEMLLSSTQLLESRWSSVIQYRYSQDVREAAASLYRPYADEALTWAANVSAAYTRTAFLQFENGAFVQAGVINQERFISWLAVSQGTTTRLQTAAAYVRTRRRSETFPIFLTDNADFLVGAVSLLHRTYRTATCLDNFGRPESLPVGYQAGAAYGVDLRGSPGGIRFMQLFGRMSVALGSAFYTSCQTSLESCLLSRTSGPGIFSYQSLHYWKILRNQTLAVRFKAVIGSHLDPVTLLVLGSSSGLRGYDNYQFVGQRLLLFNAEHRVFSGPRLWLFKIGAALFCDSGLTWCQDEDLARRRFHSSAGVGLRFENIKSAGNAILCLDAAYNFDRRRFSFIASSDLLFRAFSSMEFVEPVPGRTTLN